MLSLILAIIHGQFSVDVMAEVKRSSEENKIASGFMDLLREFVSMHKGQQREKCKDDWGKKEMNISKGCASCDIPVQEFFQYPLINYNETLQMLL